GDELLGIYTLALDVAVYAASAAIFRRRLWLYLATCLAPVPVLMALHYNQLFTMPWIAGSFTVLAFLYFGLGQLLEQVRSGPDHSAAGFALPLYLPGYLLSAAAILLVDADRSVAAWIYSANILLYALSAWRLR